VIYELAFNLGYKTVYELKTTMYYDEFNNWLQYFEQRPIDWRDDLRTYYFLKTQGYDKSPSDLFPSLAAIQKDENKKEGLKGLKQSFLFKKIQGAKGGEKIKE